MARSHFMYLVLIVSILCVTAGCTPSHRSMRATGSDGASLSSWRSRERAAYLERERELVSIPSREELLRLHLMLAEEPHVAGTPGDWRTIEHIARTFRAMGQTEEGQMLEGWSVEIEEFFPLLARPVHASVEILGAGADGGDVSLELRERPVLGDPTSANPDPLVTLAWNAYSGSGDVTAEIVYANYATKQDFERLGSLGIDCRGKIVIARYGGNYRGFKAKYAEEAGAAGLIIYTDPADSGFSRGAVYPEGGWANDCCIQRGSILTLGYQGDPLTPGLFASEHARRLELDEVALPRIPVQPIGYGAASEILKRMSGPDVPEGWRGGLPSRYVLSGGTDLRVRLVVKQEREIMRTANVLARLEGSGSAAERAQHMVIGCHHDAWVNGASDPACGTIAMLEAARAITEIAKNGYRPRRSIVFAAWGAEEFGIIGSSEYVEKRRDDLTRNCIGYINLDMASMGPHFGAAASPELKSLIVDSSRVVPAARKPIGTSVFDEWLARSMPASEVTDERPESPRLEEPPIGDLGGGSDHVPFLMHAGVPSISLGSSGSAGNSYHSVYDSLPWYWRVVGDDYEPALMITRMASVIAMRLASAPRVPHDVARAFDECAVRIRELDTLAVERGLAHRASPDAWGVPGLGRASLSAQRNASRFGMQPLGVGSLSTGSRWVVDEGLPGRPWFRNWYVATDETSGYANWLLPAVRRAIEHDDRESLDQAASRLADLIESASPRSYDRLD
ncbi:MAG: M28 family peptidase [Phycisphaeraceae bacterium]|nr:M28 family peptidase [Phycisphaeraceae bacterium]